MENLEKKWIYVLKDPRDGSKKYVGMSKNPQKRLNEHIKGCKREHTKKGSWIKKLTKLSLLPIMELLKETNNYEHEYWEEFFIKKFINEGNALLNYDEKGIGTANSFSKKTYKKLKNKLSIKINQFDINGNLIRKFNSLREAERVTKINHGNISKCCNGKYMHAGGFIFKKDTNQSPFNKIEKLNAIYKPVIEIGENGEIIAEYSSIMDASRKTGIDNGNISRVCNGKLKKIKKRFFKFKNN